MAVNPNTDFSAGAIYTAAQANRFPRGVMAYDQSTTAMGNFSSETVAITGSSFTAVANRYYKITYFEPDPYSVSSTGYMGMAIRITNISGAIKQIGYVNFVSATSNNSMNQVVLITTLAAGTTNFVGTLGTNTGQMSANRTSNVVAFLLVEDIGPA
jgi:hypothetical protein